MNNRAEEYDSVAQQSQSDSDSVYGSRRGKAVGMAWGLRVFWRSLTFAGWSALLLLTITILLQSAGVIHMNIDIAWPGADVGTETDMATGAGASAATGIPLYLTNPVPVPGPNPSTVFASDEYRRDVSAARAAVGQALGRPNVTNPSTGGNADAAEVRRAEDRYRRLFRQVDTDASGFLSSAEFAVYYTLTKENDPTFELMDINKDSILSFREVVAIIRALDGLFDDEDHEFSVKAGLAPTVFRMYEYNYTRGDDLWYEYAADIFFEAYDFNYQGFITRADYFGSAAEMAFFAYDTDQNGVLNVEEFLNSIFSATAVSQGQHFSHAMNAESNMLAVGDELAHLTEDDLASIELQMCPNVIKPTGPAARSVARRLFGECIECGVFLGACIGMVTITILGCCAAVTLSIFLAWTAPAACYVCTVASIGVCSNGLKACIECYDAW
jgi:Ca2+-binding EF-hand superfamily protein